MQIPDKMPINMQQPMKMPSFLEKKSEEVKKEVDFNILQDYKTFNLGDLSNSLTVKENQA